MAKERDAPTTATSSSWGTLEELLLACAVNRHGTKSWDSVAVEVQNRTSSLASLTSQQCRDKFNDLRRRFMPPRREEPPPAAAAAAAAVSLVPMVDELRRLRVEELRREVQRRDVSIESLELKVKRLEEERGRSSKEEADLGKEDGGRPTSAAKSAGGGYDSGEDRSFNESNSTSQQQKAGNTAAKKRTRNLNRPSNPNRIRFIPTRPLKSGFAPTTSNRRTTAGIGKRNPPAASWRRRRD